MLYVPEGKHLLIDMYCCGNTDFGKKDLESFIIKAKSTPLKYLEQVFEPYGKTGVYLLSESHLSVHSYPEHRFVGFDLYTCGLEADPFLVIDDVLSFFDSSVYNVKKVVRGVL